jgi:hypothetical protein
LNAEGLCAMHSGASDPREAGRKSGAARRKPNPERVNESLRTYLKREVPPERVWQALEAAMLGNNESARVSASRVLMDALHEPEQDKTEQRQADRQQAVAEAKARLSALLDAGVSIEDAADTLDAEAVDDHPDLLLGDVSPERAAEILAGLVETGVLDWKVEELAQRRAEELTRAFREEHGLPALPVAQGHGV